MVEARGLQPAATIPHHPAVVQWIMAKQNANPGPWDDSMADGCSGVLDFGFGIPCCRHDLRYYYGGPSPDDKSHADDLFYLEMQDPRYVPSRFWRWMARRGMARIRWTGVRFTTYNYPPGHRLRRNQDDSIEAFNWLGPGMVG